jgi:hypothetical protein
MSESRVSRRSFLQASAAGTAGLLAHARLPGATAHAAAPGVLDHLGVALYTVHDQMKADPAGTLKAIAGLGYKYVESGLLPSLAPALATAGLKQASAYAPTYLVTGNREAWAKSGEVQPEGYTWENAVAEGNPRPRYLVVVYLRRRSAAADVYRDLAKRLVTPGTRAARRASASLPPARVQYELVEGVRPSTSCSTAREGTSSASSARHVWASIAGQTP